MTTLDDFNGHNHWVGNHSNGPVDNTTFSAPMNYAAGHTDMFTGMLDVSYSPTGLEMIMVNAARTAVWIFKQDGSWENLGVSGTNFHRPTLANGIVVLQANDLGDPCIYKVPRGNPAATVKLQGGAIDPCISPDGTWLIYTIVTSYYGTPSGQLATMNIDGSHNYILQIQYQNQQTNPQSPDARMPSISRDGSYISFLSGPLMGVNFEDKTTWVGSVAVAWAMVIVGFGGYRYMIAAPTRLPTAAPSTGPAIVANPSWWQYGTAVGVIYDYVCLGTVPYQAGVWATAIGTEPPSNTRPNQSCYVNPDVMTSNYAQFYNAAPNRLAIQ